MWIVAVGNALHHLDSLYHVIGCAVPKIDGRGREGPVDVLNAGIKRKEAPRVVEAQASRSFITSFITGEIAHHPGRHAPPHEPPFASPPPQVGSGGYRSGGVEAAGRRTRPRARAPAQREAGFGCWCSSQRFCCGVPGGTAYGSVGRDTRFSTG